jgi:hypothetical protein
MEESEMKEKEGMTFQFMALENFFKTKAELEKQ